VVVVMKNLRLGLLGGFALEPAEQIGRVPKKAKALLAFLALEPGVSVSRARLAALLWDTQGERQARQSLRQALTDLRKVIPDAGRFLEVSADAAAVRPGLLDVDARELLMLDPTSVAALECVLALYRGDLLEGLDTRAAPFEEWRALESARLRERALAAMSALLEHRLGRGDASGAMPVALRLLALDPWRESAHRSLMQCYARQGRFADALRQYQLCCNALERELGVAPEPATRALHDEILRWRQAPAAASVPAGPVSAGPAPVGPVPVGPVPVSMKGAVQELVPVVPAAALSARPAPHSPAPVVADPPVPELVPVTVLAVWLDEVGASSSNRHDPEALRDTLAQACAAMTAVVLDLGGRVDRRLGALMLAVFGLDRAEPSDLLCAAKASERLHAALAPTPIRIGLASGSVLRADPDVARADPAPGRSTAVPP